MNKDWIEILEVQDLGRRDLMIAQSKFKTVHLKAKDQLLRSGEVCNFIALVVSGYVKMYCMDDHGDIQVDYLAKPGDFITCVPSFFYKKSSEKFIEANTASELLTLDRKGYDELHELVPELGWKAMEIGVKQLNKRLEERSMLNPMKAKERYDYFLTHKREFLQNVTLGDIASYLGIRIQSLSRIRKEIISELVEAKS